MTQSQTAKIRSEEVMRLKYKELYGHEGVCDIKKYNNILICTHEKECAATDVKGSSESLMEYVIKRFDLDTSNLVWINHDLWRPHDQYTQVTFEYDGEKCDVKRNTHITVSELNEMIKKSGDYIM